VSWSPAFLAALDSPSNKILWHVESIVFPEWGRSWSAATDWRGSGALTSIVEGSVRTNGYKLNMQSWAVSGGGFSFQVPKFSHVNRWLTKGHVLALQCGIHGISPYGSGTEYGTVDIGVITNITVQGADVTTITCAPFFSMLQSRLTSVVDEQRWFFATDWATHTSSTTVATDDYVAEATSLKVGALTYIHRQTGGTGMVKVTSNDGEEFYGIFTGVSGTELTGFSGGYPYASGGDADPDADADIGNAVKGVPYLKGHPCEIFRRNLASTGVGSNWDWDDYPKSWGLGLPDKWMDNEDLDQWAAVSDASGGTDLEIIVDPAPDNYMSYLLGIFALGGWFPVIRQGGISLRCVQAPDRVGTSTHVTTITDADLIDDASAVTYYVFDPTSQMQFGQLKVDGFNVTDEAAITNIGSAPSAYEHYIDLRPYVLSNVTNTIDEISDRLYQWYTKIPQRYVLRCASLRLAQLALGDWVTLSSSRCSERQLGGTVNKAAMVVGVTPDWMGGIVTVELVMDPGFAGEVS
jgi:hypothetical protein